MRFKHTRRGIAADVEPVEAQVLAEVVGELLELLGADEPEDVDPLAAMVGLSEAVDAPEDPALRRLLPDAYGDDADAAAEFRRYTDADLRAGKRADAGAVLATLAQLPEDGGRLLLDREQAQAWLTCLNDLRLVLGTRLEVDEERDVEEMVAGLPPDSPVVHAVHVYGWLGWVQESLVAALSRGLGR